MPGIYLEPESTFSVSVSSKGGGDFSIIEGDQFTLKSLNGREHAKMSKAIRENDGVKLFDCVESALMNDRKDEVTKKFGQIHPNVIVLLAYEIMKRSRLSEEQAGN